MKEVREHASHEINISLRGVLRGAKLDHLIDASVYISEIKRKSLDRGRERHMISISAYNLMS